MAPRHFPSDVHTNNHSPASRVDLLLEAREDLRVLEFGVAADLVLGALPLLLREGPLYMVQSLASSTTTRSERYRALTLHRRHGVAGLLELVLREALALKNGRFLDGLELNIVVGAVWNVRELVASNRKGQLTERSRGCRGGRRAAGPWGAQRHCSAYANELPAALEGWRRRTGARCS